MRNALLVKKILNRPAAIPVRMVHEEKPGIIGGTSVVPVVRVKEVDVKVTVWVVVPKAVSM